MLSIHAKRACHYKGGIVMDYIRQHRITSYQNGGQFVVSLFGHETEAEAIKAFKAMGVYVIGSSIRVDDLSVKSKLI